MKLGRLLMIALLVIGFLIIFGKKGLIDNYKLQQRVAELREANQKTLKENARLKQDILLLRKDPKYIERIARDELGMVRKGDTVYRFADGPRS